jgi:hypothetical protein
MGITGSGKSVILLSIANWIRKYNKVKLKDPKKRPAILFISQENSKDESFERLFNMTVSADDIRNFSDEEIIDMMSNKVGLCVKSCEDIDFIFKYYDDKEIGVSDIYNLIDDLEDDGIEVIAVIQDYINKLRPLHKYSELRHELGGVATELSQLAKNKNIPVISAAQLNRMAASTVDSGAINNKKDLTKLLGKQNVGESWAMIENTDGCIIIGKEIDESGEEEKIYYAFKLVKLRGRKGKDKIEYFVHPLERGNEILLIEDADAEKPLSRFKMEDFEPMRHGSGVSTSATAILESEFVGSFIDTIDENYSSNIIEFSEVYKHAKEIDKRMEKLLQKEKDLIQRRADEFRNGVYKRNADGLIMVGPRIKDGKYQVKRTKKAG